jgi:hypothetical protein
MAINDKENPDEGTPRSNKDIRKERRQMRAVNRDRKSMGAEPLYSKEEIKGVKQPFKAAPGNVVAGTPVVVDNTPDVEYIKAGYGSGKNEVKEVSQEFKAGTKEAEEIRKDSEAGQQLVKTLANTPNPAQETQDILQVKADNKTNLTSTEQENLTKANQEVGNEVKKLDDAITNEEIDAKNAMSNIGDVVQNKPGQDGWIDTYVTESFEPESKEDILARAAVAARKKAPQLAIEKLGVQDYYPEIGRDIAVGTFTGSRIGSQTIYSGAGGVLPLGLYDARKRAIAADIKKKQALMDELKEMPDIAKQYKPAFAQYFYNGLMDYVEAYKDNPEGLASDPGYLKFMSTEKGVAENFSKTSAYLKDLEEKLVDPKTGEPAAWVTKDMMSIINNVKTGMLPGKIEEYFSGKKNIAKVLDTVRALPNALNQGDEIVKTLIKDGGIERAINLKTGKDFNPDELEDLNNLVKQINSPSPDYEMFSELKRKYFEFKFDKIAEEWVKNNMADQSDKVKEEVKKNMANYMFEQMPKESIISTITKQANDYTTRRGQDLDLLKARERMAFEAEQNEKDRQDNLTKLEVQSMLEKGEKVRTVDTPDSKMGTQSADELIYTVYDPVQGKYRDVTGASIRRDQKQGYKYYDRTGKNLFNLPEGNPQYEQGTVTYYNSNGNVKAISKGTAYTTSFNSLTGKTEYNSLNVDVRLAPKDMTKSSGVVDDGAAGEYDVKRGRGIAGTAEGTGGTGSYSTGSSSYRRY